MNEGSRHYEHEGTNALVTGEKAAPKLCPLEPQNASPAHDRTHETACGKQKFLSHRLHCATLRTANAHCVTASDSDGRRGRYFPEWVLRIKVPARCPPHPIGLVGEVWASQSITPNLWWGRMPSMDDNPAFLPEQLSFGASTQRGSTALRFTRRSQTESRQQNGTPSRRHLTIVEQCCSLSRIRLLLRRLLTRCV